MEDLGGIWEGIRDINVKDCRLYDTIVVPVYWILAQVGAYSVVAELFLICTLKLLDTAQMRVQKLQLNLRWDVGYKRLVRMREVGNVRGERLLKRGRICMFMACKWGSMEYGANGSIQG